MSKLSKEWIESGAVGSDAIKLENNSNLKARNAADTADVNVLKVNASDEIEFASTPKVGANALLDASQKGANNGLATLDGSGLVPASQLPSYVDDVLEFADLASFPGTGATGKIYVAIDTGKTYRWTGSVYAEVSAGPADTDALAEGATNLYYTQGRFDAAFGAKTTDDLAEGSDLYFTEQRVQDSIMSDYSVGANTALANTDSLSEALGKVQGQINALATQSTDARTEVITLNGTDISNGYVTLQDAPTSVLSVVPKGGLPQEPGVDFEIDGTNDDQLNFLGDLASTLASGHKLMVTYLY